MTSGLMRHLREATAELDEATVRLVEHTVDHRELTEWVPAVAPLMRWLWGRRCGT